MCSHCRGDLPAQVDQGRPGKNGIRWKSNIELIDLHYYLPVFLDGCVEAQARAPAARWGLTSFLGKGRAGAEGMPGCEDWLIRQLTGPSFAALRYRTRTACLR